MKIITYNLNGIRAAMSKEWLTWLKATDADVVCLQETKAQPEQIDTAAIEALGYNCYYYSAQKKGYSGVAILSKQKPLHVEYGCGIGAYDFEGRVLRADFETCSVLSVYHPSGSSGDDRQAFKIQWLQDFHTYALDLKTKIPNLIISGDYNICHKAIDIHNPKSNAHTSGFLPEERAWFDGFVASGFVDSFRHLNDEPHQYTWWSYRAGARGKNLGWRIDYNMVTENLVDKITRVAILPDAMHSDHCPVLLEINV
ncbi:MAG: exodeoxyribonuclease III [Bacteroidia bacterium]|nr:exodeoxyribonuclease III [Bacteroidia bacterium]